MKEPCFLNKSLGIIPLKQPSFSTSKHALKEQCKYQKFWWKGEFFWGEVRYHTQPSASKLANLPTNQLNWTMSRRHLVGDVECQWRSQASSLNSVPFDKMGFFAKPQILMKKIQKVKIWAWYHLFLEKVENHPSFWFGSFQRFCSLLGFLIQEKSWIRVNFDSLVVSFWSSNFSDVFLLWRSAICQVRPWGCTAYLIWVIRFIWGTIICWITSHRNWMQMLLVMLHGFAWKKKLVHLLGVSLHDWTASSWFTSDLGLHFGIKSPDSVGHFLLLGQLPQDEYIQIYSWATSQVVATPLWKSCMEKINHPKKNGFPPWQL